MASELQKNKKKCAACEQLLDADKFVKDVSRPDGLFSYCKQCHSQMRAAYIRNNPGLVKELKSRNYFKNKDKPANILRVKKASKANWKKLKADPKRYKEHLQAFSIWSKTQRGRLSAAKLGSKRRELLNATSDGSITPEALFELEYRQMNACGICGCNLQELPSNELHLDHIKPLSKGGTHTIGNVQWTCRTCNLSKGNDETKSALDKRLWTIFSRYIRLKDSDASQMCTCVTCGVVKKYDKGIQAGHYISRSYKYVKYNERNVKPQCIRCNKWYQGRPLEFRDYLVKRYDEETVSEMEQDRHKMFIVENKWYIERIEHYKEEVKELLIKKKLDA